MRRAMPSEPGRYAVDAGRPLRVLPIPAAHPYPLQLRPEPGDGSAVVHLPDPVVPGAPAGQWWPPPALESEWVREHGDEVDVVHVHFGFDASEPTELERWCDTLDAAGIPLVLTVHDLVNPHFVDQRDHLARLDVLVPRTAAVVTLTEGAARRIATRWDRDATVLPHPHVAPLDELDLGHERSRDEFVVGVHLKSLRANVVVEDLLRILGEAVAAMPDGRLLVHLHREVLDASHPRHDRALLAQLGTWSARGLLELNLHAPHTDAELWAYLRSIDLSVVPYAFGTHSGWVEACYDLGTAVLAPRTGYWTEQQRCHTFGWRPGEGPVRDDVIRAVAEAYAARPVTPASRVERETQRQAVSAAHGQIYRAVFAAGTRVPAASA